MKVLYGPDYRMWIDSKPGEGTRTGIEIPDTQSQNLAESARAPSEKREPIASSAAND
jgi:hypothetical protein